MKPESLHPVLKKSLQEEVDRSAPLGFQHRIMSKIKALHQSELAAPSAMPLIIIALLIAVIMVVVPLWINYSGRTINWSALETSGKSIPSYVWYCLGFFMILFAITERPGSKSHNGLH